MTKAAVHLGVDHRGIATVTLHRPEKHNAFDDIIIAQLHKTFDTIAADSSVCAVVLASQGKSFSAGADLGWMQRMADYDYVANLADARALAEMLHALYSLPQPTIARVQGAAFGGAVGLVSCCDMAVASTEASFSLSEVKIGLIPATISPYVIRAIGERAARRFFVTGERFDSAQALQIGLISHVSSAENLDNALEAVLQQLLNNGPSAMRASKQLVSDVSGRTIDQALLDETCQRIAAIRVSQEGQEGLKAFLQKRSPQWQKD
ncbi:MAG: enoyl-CoA hydratase/isomerase family protein [Gammaproteobacteria bacterium]|nr:enoyl-CoA hydratase/isomerase family protein [Gammaproteobacteria bacterium]